MTSSLRQCLYDNQTALGVFMQFSDPGIIECIHNGWDWLWIDGQHGQHDYRSVLACVRTADACGIAPIVRVTSNEPGRIGAALDMRPAGVMVPMVNSVDEARAIVTAATFPPLGERSYGGRRVIDLGSRNYYSAANNANVIIAQIETPQAAHAAEAIAAVDGIDVIFFSADDLKLRMGLPIEATPADSDKLSAVMAQVMAAARNTGKIAGCIACTPESVATAVEMGYRLIAGGGDVPFLRNSAAQTNTTLRNALK